MAKDSFWFKHDSSAGRGLRMRKMAFIYGHWGKGIYWDVVEVLRDQDGYMFSHDETSLLMLCDIIGCKDSTKFISWFNDCLNLGLFEKDEKHFFSAVLCENMDTWESKKHNGSQGGRGNKKANQKLIESETKANQNHKRREDKRREDKRTQEKEEASPILSEPSKNSTNLIDHFFNDLPGSAQFERIAMDLKIQPNILKTKIEPFRKCCETSYPNFDRFCSHFKNWVRKSGNNQTLTTPRRNQLL